MVGQLSLEKKTKARKLRSKWNEEETDLETDLSGQE